ncbi:hypothetical protein [Corynebacterium timonense]|uniref:hypothetical protein n=1 Tax=Corynebacterium timonense TaxID=441500 RepID=UPI0012EA3200|nr:hypothetical protein [Corynebacterium timonense]
MALIDAPWARDAAGKVLPTHYEVAGDTFTQVVEVNQPDVAYPIEADPRVNELLPISWTEKSVANN